MSDKKNNLFTVKRISTQRKMLIAAMKGNNRDAIHCMTEIDVSVPRKRIKTHFEKSGEKISFTA